MNVERPDKPAGTDTWLDIKGWYNVIVPWLRWCVGEIAHLRTQLAKAQKGENFDR